MSFLLLCLIWNADAAENLSVGRECVDGGVEDRGQVKLKHGAKEKQRPPNLSHLTTHNTFEYKGTGLTVLSAKLTSS